jgi:ribosomal protein S18 acetylase RimI-like enzyme|tara:strand:+ start:33577 stop:34128 length:552 start_codon:yes stop_codon:yes gene_type:complete
MNFLNINFENNTHLKYINILSKRNNFYKDDLNKWLYSNDIKSSFNNWNNYYINNKNKNIYIIPLWQGVFLSLNNKIIGFIIFYQRHYNDNIGNFISIEFMLIDKEFQNKGYGKILFNYIFNKFTNIDFITVCIENKNEFINFYYKIGFIDYKLIFNNKCKNHQIEFSTFLNNNDFNWLYYIIK